MAAAPTWWATAAWGGGQPLSEACSHLHRSPRHLLPHQVAALPQHTVGAHGVFAGFADNGMRQGTRDEAGNPACGCYCGSPTPDGCVRALAPPNPYAGPERTLEGPDTDPPAPRGRAAPARTATSRLLPRTAEPLPVRPGPAPALRNRPLEGSPLPCPQGRAPPPRPCRHSEHHPLTHPLRPQEQSWLCGDVLGSPQETH